MLGADGNVNLKGWIDVSVPAHPNMKRCVISGMSMGKGFPISSSMKLKLKTRSSAAGPVVSWKLSSSSSKLMEHQAYETHQFLILLHHRPHQSEGLCIRAEDWVRRV